MSFSAEGWRCMDVTSHSFLWFWHEQAVRDASGSLQEVTGVIHRLHLKWSILKRWGRVGIKKGPQTLDQRCYINLAKWSNTETKNTSWLSKWEILLCKSENLKRESKSWAYVRITVDHAGKGTERFFEKIIFMAFLDFQKPFWNTIMPSQFPQFIYSIQIQHKVHNYIDSKALDNACIAVH